MRVLAINDVSCVGKCSLTVALPIISACGVTCDILPTALLSTHTGGFTGYTFRDLSEDIPAILAHWKSLGLRYDYIVSGYLGSIEQIEMVKNIKAAFLKEGGTMIVDPVMGDDGKLYQTITEDHAAAMIRLARKADIITPNFTEASIIADIGPLPKKLDQRDIKDLVTVLRSLGPQKGAITSIPLSSGGLGNAAWDGDEIRLFQYEDIGVSYPGSGDLFASIVFALTVKGDSFFGSVLHATSIASIAIASAKAKGRDRRLGIELSPAIAEIRRRAL